MNKLKSVSPINTVKHYIVVLLAILIICACTTTKYVPVEVIKTEYKTNTVRDSIYFEKHDSIYFEKLGDTVTIHEWHIRYKDRYIEVTDTFLKTDSIPVPYPVEKQLTRWQQIKLDFGELFLLIVLVLVFYNIVKAYLRR